MTEEIRPEQQRLIDALLGSIIVDPDPERRTITCSDCLTPTLALLVGMLVVRHDPSCPAFAAMTAEERTQINDEDTVVHVVVEPVSWGPRAT